MSTNSVEISPAPKMLKLISIFLTILGIFLGVKTLQSLGILDPNPYPREMTLEATGSAFVTPDTARVSFGVTEQGDTAEALVESNNTKMNAIIKAIKEEGVEAEDIQTTNYTLYPRYSYSEEKGSYQDGFEISQTVMVDIRDFAKIGAIIQKATGAGATNLNSTEFVVEDEDAAKALAREDALEQLKAKAKTISQATGLRFGKVVNFYEYPVQDYYGMGKGGMYMEGAETMAEDSVATIEPGQSEIQLSVSLTYRLR